MVTNTSDSDGSADGRGDANVDGHGGDAYGADARGDSSQSDGTMASDASGADQVAEVDAEVQDASEDPFSTFPPDASPDSRAGIEEACLHITIPYLQAPIVPPYAAAGLDLHGGPTGNGSEGWDPADAGSFHYDPSLEGPGPLTIDQVESVLCFPDSYLTCVELNDASGMQACAGLQFAGFNKWGGFVTYYGTPDGGPPYDVWAIQLQAWLGTMSPPPVPNLTYAGTIEATGGNGTHFSVGMDVPITETPSGGAATTMDFASVAATDGGAPETATKAMVNALYAAMMAQFLPASPIAPDCFASDECNAVFTVAPQVETLVFVPLHLEIDVVVDGPIYPSHVATNHVLDVILYANPPPQSG